MEENLKLICYDLGGGQKLRPAPLERDWMDRTDQKYAYRCLPLNIANMHGWEILCSSDCTARWDGGATIDSVKVSGQGMLPVSHFGTGVLTFHVHFLFRTEPGYNLYVTGPVNRNKADIVPLSGVVETDWAPYTFTMNWIFTRANEVTFKIGEPICTIFPIPRALIESVEPEFRPLEDDSELAEAYRGWVKSRNDFNTDLKVTGSAAQTERWQKSYFKGKMPGGGNAEHHQTKLRLRPFK